MAHGQIDAGNLGSGFQVCLKGWDVGLMASSLRYGIARLLKRPVLHANGHAGHRRYRELREHREHRRYEDPKDAKNTEDTEDTLDTEDTEGTEDRIQTNITYERYN